MASEAEAEKAVPSNDVLEWVKKDKKRFLHAVYRVGDLERTIKFYIECFGMELLRQRDIPEEKYSNAFLGFGPEDSHFVVELTYTLVLGGIILVGKVVKRMAGVQLPAPAMVIFHLLFHWGVYIAMIRQGTSLLPAITSNNQDHDNLALPR